VVVGGHVEVREDDDVWKKQGEKSKVKKAR
jgi:hypothetical protein